MLIAVGTPSRREDGFADLSDVYADAREVAAAIDGFTVIVTKSTVPAGTGDEIAHIIAESRPDAEFASREGQSELPRRGARHRT